MAKQFHQLLAESLERVQAEAVEGIVKSEVIGRRDRERLLKGGWLQPIMGGWYVLCSPSGAEGSSTAWYTVFWNFIHQYLNTRYQQAYCLSAEASLDLHVGNTVIPKQIVVILKRGGNALLKLPYHTSLLLYQDKRNFPKEIEVKSNLGVMPLGLALAKVPKTYFQKDPISAKIALNMIRDPSEITHYLLQEGMLAGAGRLIGAYRIIGKQDFSKIILSTMQAAGFEVKEGNPFDNVRGHLVGSPLGSSPYYARITTMWHALRQDVIDNFSCKLKNKKISTEKILTQIDHVYVNDAYHSLSIEGYRVTPELIAKIKAGSWDPDNNQADVSQRDAMAAKGYYNAFLAVKNSIKKILDNNETPADVVEQDLPMWYQQLFSPSVEAGILLPRHLAGYRNDRVFIRNSLHVPPPREAVIDCMQAFFECLHAEQEPIVQAILGHFMFVFIHPFMDGNGRITRFMMNLFLVTSGYPWTIVRLESHGQYMKSLEQASVTNNLVDFTQLINQEMRFKWRV